MTLRIFLPALVAAALTVMPAAPRAEEIKVLASVAIKNAYCQLVPAFEAASGHKVVTEWAPTVEMLRRLNAGETPNLVIMAGTNVDQLTAAGKLAPGSRVDIARSGIGVGIKAGAPRPDIATVEGFKKALVAAKSVAWSTGPSGVYLDKLFERLGLTATLAPKKKLVQGEPVGDVIARGEAEIGFQQVPELLPVKGVDFIGQLPAEIQEVTTFAGAVPASKTGNAAVKALTDFLRTPDAKAAFKKIGMDPA